MIKKATLLFTVSLLMNVTFSQNRHSQSSLFMSYRGLIMAGYQGWFNTPDDGANMGWNHYAIQGKFEPGFCKFDFWPDITEYKKVYKTPFKLKDGSPAYVFSCYDSQTVSVHFKWLKDYHIDGVFIQRSVTAIKNHNNLLHDNRVLQNAIAASERFHRAIAIMYDFSGLKPDSGDWELIQNDWKYLVDSFHIAGRGNRQTYLYHNKKPLVGFWGIGFPDRSNDLKTTEKMIDFFKDDALYGGCSILLGVPTYWRDLGSDTEKDPYLHHLLRKIDILRPWFVGRVNEKNYSEIRQLMHSDIKWCKQNGIDYAPVVFPGFSWHNMHPESKAIPIPRNRGQFYWEQLTGAIKEGCQMLYVAMFDEIDEGTSIFKTTNNPPVGTSKFERFEPHIPSDYYLYLTGIAARMLKKQIPFQTAKPIPKH